MEQSEYAKYVDRAEFFNASGRTVDGLHGQITRKDVYVEVPKGMEVYLNNVDGKGHSFAQFCSEVVYQSLITSWGGIFIDAPKVEGIISKDEALKKGVVPFLSYVNAVNLYNWHYDNVNRAKKLTRVCIHNKVEVPTSDPFTFNEKDEYKLLFIDPETNVYRQQVRVDSAITSDVFPTKNKGYLTDIPFFPLPNTNPEKPIILDLVNVNLKWYHKSADLENGLHWTGVPTPYILGYEPEIKYNPVTGEELPKDPIYLGGSSILCLPTGTNIGYLEFVGSGLNQLRQGMQDDEDRMAILGARIISAEKRGVEAVETARIHRAGENSVLQSFANNMSDVLQKVLKTYLEWIAEVELKDEDVIVKLNTDYDVSRMSSTELTSLVSLWQSGGISKRELFRNLAEGEIIENGKTYEEMEEEIAEEKEQNLQSTIETQKTMIDAGLAGEE